MTVDNKPSSISRRQFLQLGSLLGVTLGAGPFINACTQASEPTSTPENFNKFPTVTLTSTQTETVEPSPTVKPSQTPEPTKEPTKEPTAEPKEYVPGGIFFEESLPGYDLEISPEANQEAIYNTIVASFVRFLKKPENAEFWNKVIAKHPEWSSLTNSDDETTRIQAMNEFLRESGGNIYINFFGGTGYTREGLVDLNKGIKLTIGKETTKIPDDHARIHVRTIKRASSPSTGAGGKVHVENEHLVYSIKVLPYLLEDMAEGGNWSIPMATSFLFAKLAEGQASQGFVNPNLPYIKEPFKTNPLLFIWGQGRESFYPDIKGFSKSFLRSKP